MELLFKLCSLIKLIMIYVSTTYIMYTTISREYLLPFFVYIVQFLNHKTSCTDTSMFS